MAFKQRGPVSGGTWGWVEIDTRGERSIYFPPRVIWVGGFFFAVLRCGGVGVEGERDVDAVRWAATPEGGHMFSYKRPHLVPISVCFCVGAGAGGGWGGTQVNPRGGWIPQFARGVNRRGGRAGAKGRSEGYARGGESSNSEYGFQCDQTHGQKTVFRGVRWL